MVEPVALTAQREDQNSRTTWAWGLSVASAGLALLVAGLTYFAASVVRCAAVDPAA